MGEVVGIPRSDHDELFENVQQMTDSVDGKLTDKAVRASQLAVDYMLSIVSEADDARIRGLLGDLNALGRNVLDEREIATTALMFLGSGMPASSWLVGNTAAILDEHPDTRKQLMEDPSMVSGLIEESLRYDSISQSLARTALQDIKVKDRVISAGDQVMILIGSANRDEGIFDRPDVFDPWRPNANQHLSFGHGIHFCLGAPLVRLMTRVVFEEILDYLPSFTVSLEESVPIRTAEFRGFSSLILVRE